MDFTLVKRIGGGIVLGVAVATWVAKGLDVDAMKIIFASALLILAIIMITNPSRFRIAQEEPRQPFAAVAGVFIGFISSLIGIGGATLSVPYMSLHSIPMHRAVGTASALGLVIAIPAAVGFVIIGLNVNNLPSFSIGYINLMAWVCTIPASMVVAPYGAQIAHKISVDKLRIIFAVFLAIVALNMWRKVLVGM